MADKKQTDSEVLQTILRLVGQNAEQLKRNSETLHQHSETLESLATEMREGFAEAKEERKQILEYASKIDEATDANYKDHEKRIVALEKLHN